MKTRIVRVQRKDGFEICESFQGRTAEQAQDRCKAMIGDLFLAYQESAVGVKIEIFSDRRAKKRNKK